MTDLPRTRRALEHGIEEGLHLGAQAYVSLAGEAVELTVGERVPGQPMTPDTLMIWLSSSKPLAAVAFAQLWEREAVDLDDAVVRYVPEFGAHGKDRITLRHVLTHTAGIRMLNVGWPEASWDEIIATICGRRPEPRWVPGEKAGYHLSSSWFLLGEVIRRVDGRHYRDYVREEIFEALRMDDSWVGMPRRRFADYGERIGRMYSTEHSSTEHSSTEHSSTEHSSTEHSSTEHSSTENSSAGSAEPLARGWHREAHVVGCSPGSNGYGPIRELGRFYEMLLAHGSWRGRRLLRPPTVEALVTPHRVGLLDRTFKVKLDWGLGFICNSRHYGEDLIPYGYGRHASRRTFGHSGFQSSTGFADPEHGLAAAVVVNGQPGEPRHTERFREITESIYEDLDLVTARD